MVITTFCVLGELNCNKLYTPYRNIFNSSALIDSFMAALDSSTLDAVWLRGNLYDACRVLVIQWMKVIN